MCDSYEIPKGLWEGMSKLILTFILNFKGSQRAKTKKYQNWSLTLPNFKS